jgi:diguanylate cyclase
MIRHSQQRARILIADDNPSVRDVLRLLLEENFDCTEVSSAEEALELLRKETFQLVLSDITMGGMSGLDMVPYALQLAPDAIVIMISGEQTVESAINAMRVGAFDYITKPFDLRHVEAAVHRALNHQELILSKRRYELYLEELLKERTDQVNRLSFFDSLTGLPNRTLFEDRLAQAIHSAHRNKEVLCVMLVDVDRFKTINDTLGPVIGDELLHAVATRLQVCFTENETVARIGSNEFAVLLPNNGPEHMHKTWQDVSECFNQSFNCGGRECYVTASTGMSFYPLDGLDAHDLIKNAGAALFRVKKEGGNSYQFYTSEMSHQAIRRLSLESSLRGAVDRGEFTVFYQPQVRLNTMQMVGVEALLRWNHPEHGMISPLEFIPLLEETGMILPVGEWVLTTACLQARQWQNSGYGSIKVAVNLSPRQFRQAELAEIVSEALLKAELEPTLLELELTESSVMSDPEETVRILERLKGMNVGIAIDDFGTGYSSLSYLRNFPITTLKIDKSFMAGCGVGTAEGAIVKAIVALARSLEMQVKAEGVETVEQLDFLRTLGCDEIQGYLFSRPVPAESIIKVLQRRGNIGRLNQPDMFSEPEFERT